jgi:sortase A
VTTIEEAPTPPEVRDTDAQSPPPTSPPDPYAKPEPTPRRSRRRRPMTRTALTVTWVAMTACLLALWTLLFGTALSNLQEQSSQGRLYDQLREELGGGDVPAPLGGAIDPGSPVALLTIPRIGLEQVVVEGTASQETMLGPGHRRDTALPGQAGVSVLYGRAVSYGGPFRDIGRLQKGDSITVATGQGTFTYTVDDVRVPGEPLPPPVTGTASRLTLLSIQGTGWRRGWAPQSAVYVDATLQGTAQPAPAGRPATVTQPERAMQGDTASLPVLVLWLQALVVAAGAVTWAAIRWGGWQAWLVGFGLVLGLLWGATAAAWPLLPNML